MVSEELLKKKKKKAKHSSPALESTEVIKKIRLD